jgi:hypothetical protein
VSTIPDLIDAAHKAFHFGSRGSIGCANPFYVPVPVQITSSSLSEKVYDADDKLLLSNGIADHLVDFAVRTSPGQVSFGVCVGQYGLGKTELVFQISEQFRRHGQPPQALPVSLHECRRLAHSVVPGIEHGTQALANFLFAPLMERVADSFRPEGILNSIKKSIELGETLLILDGVDELGLKRRELQEFFSLLLDLISTADGLDIRSAVFVTVRLEYLASLGISDVVGLFGYDPSEALQLRLRFFRLQLFSDSHIERYLSLRDQDDVFETLKRFPQLLQILRRPLFLKVFSDMFGSSATVRELREMARAPVKLIEGFVTEQSHTAQEESLGPFRWDNDKITQRALDLYRLRRSDLSVEEVGALLSVPKGHALTRDEIWMSIHKCPFLIKTGENTVQFAHKMFLEYFTARALALEVQAERAGERSFTTFDELVVDVDTRKFVRDMLGRDRWIERTYFTYGLSDVSWWEKCNAVKDIAALLARLDGIRITLLDYLTDPDLSDIGEARRAIWDFFELEGFDLHPNYLIYNYEAVTIFLWYNSSDEHDIKIEAHFRERLKLRFDEVVALLYQGGESRHYWERLVERILSIAERLRIESITRYRIDKLIEAIEDPVTKTRIQHLQSARWRTTTG